MFSLNQELEHLEEIRKKLNIALEKEKESLDKQKNELLSERKKMWEEGAHGVNDFDDIVSMATYDERVREEFGHYVRKDETVRQLSYLLKTPYFGRIDFLEDGLNKDEKIYIGRYGFCNKDTYEYEIYDWRTPIANMFYDCSMGRASYKCPAGEITGELTCKRQYQIKEGNLEYCYDTNMAVQDELLGKVLSENTDKVLRVIIDTITKDQNYAIRQPYGTDLLITGPAGSGKTSVGMHRLAYLLYHNRSNLASDKIVVMSRNQIFSSYIEGILPELGEENVQDVLFDELINRGISRDFKKKSYYERVEFLLKDQQVSIRKRSLVLKYSKEFLEYIKAVLKGMRVQKNDAETCMELYLKLLYDYAIACEDNPASDDVRVEKADALRIYKYTKTCLEKFELNYEDILILGYIRILMGAIRPMEQISHVVLDEAQDYNRLQLMILRSIYPKSRFTILADVNQAVYPEISTMDLSVFHQIFGRNMKDMVLGKSYRSTAPINKFAFDILGIHDPALYINRPGKEPEHIITTDMIGAIRDISSKIAEDKSIAILTCDKESALSIKQRMGNRIEGFDRKIEYILKPDRSLEEKIVVMPIMLAKGLEFDVVIIWDDRSDEYWKQNKHLKYLMCTRALHELYIVTKDR